MKLSQLIIYAQAMMKRYRDINIHADHNGFAPIYDYGENTITYDEKYNELLLNID